MIARRWRDLLAERGIKVHPAADLFPLLTDTAPDQLRELADDIKKNGIQQPVVLWTPTPIGRAVKERFLLDGRNRLDALELAFGDDSELFAEKLADTLYVDPHGGARLLYGDDEDPWDFVASANAHRRHLTSGQKHEIVEKLLKAKPERSDRATARIAKVSPTTVGTVRAALEDSGDVSKLDTRTDTVGRQQPALRRPPSPPSKSDQIRALRERGAEGPAEPSDGRNPRDVVEAHKLLGLLHNIATNSGSIDLKRARRGLSEVELDRAWGVLSQCENWLRQKVEPALRGEE